MVLNFENVFPPAFQISSTGPAADYMGGCGMGRFELIVGEAREGSPVYKQAHSGMLGKKKDTLLYRYVCSSGRK